MEEIYKKEICPNCANEKCTNRIRIINKPELIMEDQIRTETTVKCEDFICKNKSKRRGLKLDGRW